MVIQKKNTLWINKISEIMEEVDKHKKQKSGELKRKQMKSGVERAIQCSEQEKMKMSSYTLVLMYVLSSRRCTQDIICQTCGKLYKGAIP